MYPTPFWQRFLSGLMGTTPSGIPSWLKAAHTLPHLEASLCILSDRETMRESARHDSCDQHDPSRGQDGISKDKTALKDIAHYSVSVGHHPNNQWGNRYMDIEPYDRTRVVLEGCGGRLEKKDVDEVPRSRYLNGNWVRELYGAKWWIATQAPLPTTSHAFLSLILQPISRPSVSVLPSTLSPPTKASRVRTVVQLTRNIESGRRKAHDYFPPIVGQSWVVNPEPECKALPIKVTLLDSQTTEDARCIQSTVSIVPITPSRATADERSNEEPLIFRHMLYDAWPDHGVPERKDYATLLNFLRLVDLTNKDISSQPHSGDLDPDPPIIVGCSAGVGRTGSFVALSSLLRVHDLIFAPCTPAVRLVHSPAQPLLPPSPLGPLPDILRQDLIAHEIDSLREQRPGMVQRKEQILLIYEALTLAFTK